MWGLQTWPHVSLKPWAATRPTTVLRQWLTSLMVNPIHPPSAHTTVREVVNAERGGNGWLNIWQLQSAQRLFLGDESLLLSQPQGAGTFTAQKSSFLDGAGGRTTNSTLRRAMSGDGFGQSRKPDGQRWLHATLLTIACQPYTEPQEYRTTSLEISKSLFIVNEDQPFLSETVKTRLSGNPL